MPKRFFNSRRRKIFLRSHIQSLFYFYPKKKIRERKYEVWKTSFKKSEALNWLNHNAKFWLFTLILSLLKNQSSDKSWLFQIIKIRIKNQKSILRINRLDTSDFLKDVFNIKINQIFFTILESDGPFLIDFIINLSILFSPYLCGFTCISESYRAILLLKELRIETHGSCSVFLKNYKYFSKSQTNTTRIYFITVLISTTIPLHSPSQSVLSGAWAIHPPCLEWR